MSDRQLTTGEPVPEDGSHRELRPDGQQKGYVVLSPEERAKGFVNPYRDRYMHSVCGRTTSMGAALSETYARDPWFYSGTFCVECGAHFPLDQFTWSRDGESLDPLKWSKETFERVQKAKAALRDSQSAKEAK
jgi:hypothetical protein